MTFSWYFSGGLPETRCGQGSTIAATVNVRKWLPHQLNELGIKTIIDAPCGDCNWISEIELGEVNYMGFELDPENVRRALVNGMKVCQFDIVNQTLPSADLLLCRDFLQHLPDLVIFAFLIRQLPRFKFVAFTSHHVRDFRSLAKAGKYRPINLLRPPFNWQRPIRHVEDGDGRMLAIWDLR